MMDKAMLGDLLYDSPLALLAIKDKQVINELNNLIPYSTAFEIECDMVGLDRAAYYPSDEYSSIIRGHNEIFKSIPDIMSVQNDSGEQRYRIPNGIRGIICIYHISKQLKLNSLLNPDSGIHYHVDCSDCFDQICDLVGKNDGNREYILSELDTWLEGDTAFDRGAGSWFKLNSLQTIEFRLGEMTFEYGRILKRIIHCNRIVKKFKDQIKCVKEPMFEAPDSKKLIEYARNNSFISKNNKWQHEMQALNKQLESINIPFTDSVKITEDIKSMTRNRSHKVG